MFANTKKIIANAVILLVILPQISAAAEYKNTLPNSAGHAPTINRDVVLKPVISVISARQNDQTEINTTTGEPCEVISPPRETNMLQDTASGVVLNRLADCFSLNLGKAAVIENLAVEPLIQPKVKVVMVKALEIAVPVTLQRSLPQSGYSLQPAFFALGIIKFLDTGYIQVQNRVSLKLKMQFYTLSIHQLQVMRC